MTGIAPVGVRTRRMMADSTSASSGLMTRSRSVSVLDGAICSSGTSSPVVGRRYWTRLWCDSSVSSSIRMPVDRRTSTVAQAQNARSSSMPRSRRRPVAGSSTQILSVGRVVIERVKVCPRKVNAWPGRVWQAAASSAAAVARRWSTVRTSTGSTGSRSRVRASMRAFRRLAALRWLISSSLTGQGATHRPQRAGSSIAHWARSR